MEEVYQNSQSSVPRHWPSYFFMNKDFLSENDTCIKKTLFQKLEEMKSWYCENNYNNLQKIIIAVSCFAKRSIVDDWRGSQYASSSEYPRVLNSPVFWICLVLNVPEFWIKQGSEYISDFEYARILNIREFWKCQG